MAPIVYLIVSLFLCPLRKKKIHTTLKQTAQEFYGGHTYRYKFPVPFGGRLVSERPERAGLGGWGDTNRERGRAADKSRVM